MPTNEGAQTFDEWWEADDRAMYSTEPYVVAKRAWNAGVSAAVCELSSAVDYIDYGVEKRLCVHVERRARWEHLNGKPFVIRRFVTTTPLIEGAAYGTEMVERRVLPDRRQPISRTK